MNMIILFESDFRDNDVAVLTDRRHEHIVSILKAEEGDDLTVGLINGPVGQGLVLEVGPERTCLKISYKKDPVLKIPVTVVLALPRPPVFRRVVSALTSMGVVEMFFIHTSRVEKSYWNSPSLKEENIRQAVILGLEQSCDTVVPKISFARQFKPFVEDVLPGIMEGKIGLLAHPQKAVSCPADIGENSVLAVGPEGGFTDYEVEKFCSAGFQTVHLGPRILRVETAVSAFVGRVMRI